MLAFRPADAIADRPLLVKSLLVLRSWRSCRATAGDRISSPAPWRMHGAALLLFLDNWHRPNEEQSRRIHASFGEVEWITIFFFVGLFVIVGGVEHAGVLYRLARGRHLQTTGGDRTAGGHVLVLWASAFLSALVDNIPFVATMIPVIKGMAPSLGGEEALRPVWWALSLGACLGGNGTLIGASANLTVAGHRRAQWHRLWLHDLLEVRLSHDDRQHRHRHGLSSAPLSPWFSFPDRQSGVLRASQDPSPRTKDPTHGHDRRIPHPCPARHGVEGAERSRDPEAVDRRLRGDLEKTSDTEFTAKVVAKVGPVKARFTGKVTLSDLDPPNGYKITGEGQGGAAGFAKGGAEVHLEPEGDGTLLKYEVNAAIGGKLAQIGSRLIDGHRAQDGRRVLRHIRRPGRRLPRLPRRGRRASAASAPAAADAAATRRPNAATDTAAPRAGPPWVWVGGLIRHRPSCWLIFGR